MKAGAEGQRNGAGSKVVTPAEMELSRLRESCPVRDAWIAEHGQSFALSERG